MGWHEDGTFRRGKRLDEPMVDDEASSQFAPASPIENLDKDVSCVESLRNDGKVAAVALGFVAVGSASLAYLIRQRNQNKGNS